MTIMMIILTEIMMMIMIMMIIMIMKVIGKKSKNTFGFLSPMAEIDFPFFS